MKNLFLNQRQTPLRNKPVKCGENLQWYSLQSHEDSLHVLVCFMLSWASRSHAGPALQQWTPILSLARAHLLTVRDTKSWRRTAGVTEPRAGGRRAGLAPGRPSRLLLPPRRPLPHPHLHQPAPGHWL